MVEPNTPPPTSSNTDRPAWACALCRPPKEGRPWRKADDGYRTCSSCLDRLRENLTDVADRYAQLDPTPGATGDSGPRPPGFTSSPPLNVHVVCLRDPRSSETAKIWVGGDGRVHFEDERPPLSVFAVLDTAAWTIADERGYTDGHQQTTVAGLCDWLDRQLDWLTRDDLVSEVNTAIRRLAAQLRAATGERRVYIGNCSTVIDEGEHTRVCGMRLYAPLKGDTVECFGCGSEWDRDEWLRLGLLLDAS